MKYDICLFDFDGTIADTGEGIRRSVAYALEKLGYAVPDEATLNRFIGPPLHDAFKELFGMDDAQAERAIEVYRERYVDIGLYESFVYPGMAPLLKELHRRGAWVAVASSKPTFMLERLSKHFGLDGWIDKYSGVGLTRHAADKRDLLLAALPEGADPGRVAMVGDRRFDMEAARALGFSALGAGFGYAPAGELEASGAEAVFDTPRALAEHLTGGLPRGRFISVEGSDGCGKSTQIALLREWIEARGWEVVVTREPGGCPISEKIRDVLLSLESTGMSAECEALLYAASRVEHVREVIAPALEAGKVVICDRYLDSSIAYQAYGRELGEEFIRLINEPATRLATPDATLLLELDRETAKGRLAGGAPADRLESEREDFFARVRRGYDAIRAAEGRRVRAIDAGKSIEEVFGCVREAVGEALGL